MLFVCCTKDEIEAEKMMLKGYFEQVRDKNLIMSLCFQVGSDRDDK